MENERCIFCGKDLAGEYGVIITARNKGFKEVDGYESLVKCYLVCMCEVCRSERKGRSSFDEDIFNAILDFRKLIFSKKPSIKKYYGSPIALFKLPEWTKGFWRKGEI